MSRKENVFCLRLTPEQKSVLEGYAKREKISLAEAVRRAVDLLIEFESFHFHNPDKEGYHIFLSAPLEGKNWIQKPYILTFIHSWRVPENISREELREMEEALDEEHLSPGERLGEVFTGGFERPEEALAEVASLLEEVAGKLDEKKFLDELNERRKNLATFYEDDFEEQEYGEILGILSGGKEEALKFLEARERDALEGKDTFLRDLAELKKFEVVHVKEGKEVFRKVVSSLEEAEKLLRKRGLVKTQIRYGLKLI